MRSYLFRFLVACTGLALSAFALSYLTDTPAPAVQHVRRASVRSLPSIDTPAVEVAQAPEPVTPVTPVTSVAPVAHVAPTTTTTVPPAPCPTDGTEYPFGSCVVPDDVLPAPASMSVEQGAPTKVCEYQGTKFECPASMTVPVP